MKPMLLPRLEPELRESRVADSRRAISHERAVVIHPRIIMGFITLRRCQTQFVPMISSSSRRYGT